jgi:hypothetical protein
MYQADTALIRIILPGPASMLVHRHSIMKLLPQGDWTAVTKSLILDWNSWGPPITAIKAGVTTTYGQRSLPRSNSGMGIYDFNTYHVRRSVKTKEPDPYVPYHLAHPVNTKLPCVEIASPIQNFSARPHIADGAVMGMNVSLSLIDRHFADISKAVGSAIEVLYFGQ